MTTAESTAQVTNVEPGMVRDWLARGEAVLIDVREPFEHSAERIDGAALCPLSTFDAADVAQRVDGKRVVFHCRSGSRSRDAANRFVRAGTSGGVEAYNLAGGIEAWKSASLPTLRAAGAPRIDVMRQVQITAGALVLVGVLLGAFVSPWFLILSGFVGGGLMVAGASGFCGMAKVLAMMPWNRVGR